MDAAWARARFVSAGRRTAAIKPYFRNRESSLAYRSLGRATLIPMRSMALFNDADGDTDFLC
jgi:hypothetical protein